MSTAPEHLMDVRKAYSVCRPCRVDKSITQVRQTVKAGTPISVEWQVALRGLLEKWGPCSRDNIAAMPLYPT
jgi:hypothetical protein